MSMEPTPLLSAEGWDEIMDEIENPGPPRRSAGGRWTASGSYEQYRTRLSFATMQSRNGSKSCEITRTGDGHDGTNDPES
jgi:hypothetical protein